MREMGERREGEGERNREEERREEGKREGRWQQYQNGESNNGTCISECETTKKPSYIHYTHVNVMHIQYMHTI